MGWLFGFEQTREELVARRTSADDAGYRCLRHRTIGNVLWTVWEHTVDGEPPRRFIGCDLLARSGKTWGYKSMSESMGPYYFTCPLSYLDLVPVANESWREAVRQYHARRSIKATLNDVLVFEGLAVPHVTITGKQGRSLLGTYDGRLYRIPPKYLQCVTEHRRASENRPNLGVSHA
jgi:hypothetical protein